MEAWDGPAAIAFTDGRVVGATLDRNGLRPRPLVRDRRRLGGACLGGRRADGRAANVPRKGGLQPGKLFLVDLAQGRIVPDEETKREVATRKPYGAWVEEEQLRLSSCRPRRRRGAADVSRCAAASCSSGTRRDMKAILAPLARNAERAGELDGSDTPISGLTAPKPLCSTRTSSSCSPR